MTVRVTRQIALPMGVLLVALGLLGGTLVLSSGRSLAPAEAPLRVLPAGAKAVNFTDWSSLRRDFDDPINDGRLRDLTTRSTLAGYRDVLVGRLALDVARLDWEVTGTTRDGAVLAIGLGGQDPDRIEKALRATGFSAAGGGFAIDDSTLAQQGIGELRVLRYVRLRGDQLLAADSPEGIEQLVAVARGHGAALGSVRSMRHEIAALLPAQSFYVTSPTDACADADPRPRGPEVGGQVEAALAEAGTLETYRWAGRALRDGGRQLTIAMEFGSAGVAAEQARVRGRLSTGPFIGRTGRIEDALTLIAARHQDTVTVLRFTRDPDATVVMSSIGPMLFAAC